MRDAALTALARTGDLESLPFVVRATPRADAARVVSSFIESAAGRIGENLVQYASGGGKENAGLALAIADMLLRAPGGDSRGRVCH